MGVVLTMFWNVQSSSPRPFALEPMPQQKASASFSFAPQRNPCLCCCFPPIQYCFRPNVFLHDFSLPSPFLGRDSFPDQNHSHFREREFSLVPHPASASAKRPESVTLPKSASTEHKNTLNHQHHATHKKNTLITHC